jgi:hypothetical protein
MGLLVLLQLVAGATAMPVPSQRARSHAAIMMIAQLLTLQGAAQMARVAPFAIDACPSTH